MKKREKKMTKSSRSTDKRILHLLSYYPNGVDRDSLSKRAKLPRSTVYDSLYRLLIKGLIEYNYKKKRNKVGRKKTLWRSLLIGNFGSS